MNLWKYFLCLINCEASIYATQYALKNLRACKKTSCAETHSVHFSTTENELLRKENQNLLAIVISTP
jgi:hypothetical protein